MKFKRGDIIKWQDDYFEVETNEGSSGSVWELNSNKERTGTVISNFYWEFYDEAARLIRKGNNND